MNGSTIEADVKCFKIWAPIQNISLAIESACPHSFESPWTCRLIQTYTIHDKCTNCGWVFSTCHRFLPRESNLNQYYHKDGLTLVKYESNLLATFMSLYATNSSPSSLSRIKSRPPRLRSGISAIFTGVLTTASGIYVSNSRKSRKWEFVRISKRLTNICK